ncbi:MAG: pseudouridine synthase [Rikenellaceae bacterium]
MKQDPHFHRLSTEIDTSTMRLNNPYDYQPHPLVVEAAQQFRAQLEATACGDEAMSEELRRGKMLGVLVVRSSSGDVGYLAAFSGALAGRTAVEGCVAPIYDLDGGDGYFRREERRVTALGIEIEEIERSPEYSELRRETETIIDSTKQQMEEARAAQLPKSELKRLLTQMNRNISEARQRLSAQSTRLDELRRERSELSSQLQRWLYRDYKVVNGRDEWRSLYSIFEERVNRLPPAGAGECAAPKLLHYALVNDYTPLSIGEFWVGASPRGEVRRDGQFYGACRGKCHPILGFVLQGIEVEEVDERLRRERRVESELQLIYEDEEIFIFNKPSGLLSVEGLIDAPSVATLLAERDPAAKLVHRLDQDTSGLLLAARTPESYRALQRQFSERTLQKRYVALLESSPSDRSGEIALPLCTNHFDRPRQMVDYTFGKSAHTSYEVIEPADEKGYTRVALYPHTGRTHQLRLHCAHAEGLAVPIVGDRLYGRGIELSDRLMLHAESITFTHPTTGERVSFTAPPTF